MKDYIHYYNKLEMLCLESDIQYPHPSFEAEVSQQDLSILNPWPDCQSLSAYKWTESLNTEQEENLIFAFDLFDWF